MGYSRTKWRLKGGKFIYRYSGCSIEMFDSWRDNQLANHPLSMIRSFFLLFHPLHPPWFLWGVQSCFKIRHGGQYYWSQNLIRKCYITMNKLDFMDFETIYINNGIIMDYHWIFTDINGIIRIIIHSEASQLCLLVAPILWKRVDFMLQNTT